MSENDNGCDHATKEEAKACPRCTDAPVIRRERRIIKTLKELDDAKTTPLRKLKRHAR